MTPLRYYQTGWELTEVGSLRKNSIVAAQPKFEEVNDAPHHRLLSFYHGRQVDLDLVFKYIGVDPHKDFFFVDWEDHILIDDEIPIESCVLGAGLDDGFGAVKGLWTEIEWFEVKEWISGELLGPDIYGVVG